MMVMMMTSQVMMAQTTVKGVLMDETLGEAEPFATVRVFKADKTEKPVAMFLTNENGEFKQEVKGKGKFDGTKRGGEMAGVECEGMDDVVTQFETELLEVGDGECPEVIDGVDAAEDDAGEFVGAL